VKLPSRQALISDASTVFGKSIGRLVKKPSVCLREFLNADKEDYEDQIEDFQGRYAELLRRLRTQSTADEDGD
jgi:hypothetical protein